MGLFPIKKVDKDAMVTIKYFGTSLGHKCVELFFNSPNVANLGFRQI